MRIEFLKYLECLSCRGGLSLPGHLEDGGTREIEDGTLDCDQCGVEYPIVRSVRRFVQSDNYAAFP
jgi:hypothetical protein